jgi:DnaJ-class molecular chaperone
MQFKDLDWARKKLGLLNDFATKNEIKKAHQTLAFSSHPDKNPDTPGIEKEFDEITKAYKILVDYYEACKQAGQGDSCFFNEEEFKKNAILVEVLSSKF